MIDSAGADVSLLKFNSTKGGAARFMLLPMSALTHYIAVPRRLQTWPIVACSTFE